MKIINFCLILLSAGLIAHAQSAFKISAAQAITQSTNKPFAIPDNFSAMIKADHQYPIFSVPHEHGSNTEDFMITGRFTNSVFCVTSATNTFRAIIKATETSSTTNLNFRAAYSRVANESTGLLMTNKAADFHNPLIESK